MGMLNLWVLEVGSETVHHIHTKIIHRDGVDGVMAPMLGQKGSREGAYREKAARAFLLPTGAWEKE